MSFLLYFFCHYSRGAGNKLAFLLVQHAGSVASVVLFGHLVALLGAGSVTARQAVVCVVLIAAVDAVVLLCQYSYNISLLKSVAQAARCLKEEALEHLIHLDSLVRSSSQPGEWEQRISGDTQMVASCAHPAMWSIIGTFIAFVFVSGVMIYEHPLFLLLILLLSVAFYSIYRRNTAALNSTARNARETCYIEGTNLLDFLSLTPIMGLFRVTQHLLARFSEAAGQVEASSIAVEKRSQTYITQIRGVVLLGYITCLAISAGICQQGMMGLGELVANMMLIGQLSGQMGQLVFTLPSLHRGAESAKALNEVFGMLEKAGNRERRKEVQTDREMPTHASLLSLHEVSFCYTDGPPILRHLNWVVKEHEYHSILGRNGAGKSTLIRLLLGSLKVQGGSVRRRYHRAGYVPQMTSIFKGSLLENITLCNESLRRDDVERVIHTCHLDDLLQRLGGLDAEVTREHLSGGESQRIGIARALVIQPDLLVVDEITNNLDIVNKSIIFETLRELRHTCTIISISHDMESLADSDFCWLLHRGRLQFIPNGTAEEKRAYAFRIIQSTDSHEH